MSRAIFMLGILACFVAIGAPAAYADTGSGGNSFAWFRDNDGDGIPNGMDDDWVRPEDGSGYQLKHGFGFVLVGPFAGQGVGPANEAQYRQRKNQPEAPGDCLRIHLELRDGSCK